MAESTRIFVSHSHKDNAWCRDFVAALRVRGADVWYDEQNLNIGVLSEEIFREIRARPVFIPVLSPAAIRSEWAKREGFAAIHLRDEQVERLSEGGQAVDPMRQILPVVARKCEVPLWWIDFKRFAANDDSNLPPAEAAESVAQALRLPPPPPKEPRAPPPTPTAIIPPAPDVPTRVPPEGPGSARSTAPGTGKRYNPTEAGRAITDVIDEQGRLLVRYPPALVAGLILAGYLSVIVAGFFGYTSSAGIPLTPLDSIFKEPWLLYVWLCLLIMLLQASVLRHPLVRPQLILTLTATVVSATVAGLLGFVGIHLPPATGLSPLTVNGFIRILPSAWTYTLVNFGILAIFWYSTVSHWIRQRNLYQPDPRESVLASVRLVAGDLVAATLLALALAVVFQPDTFALFMPTPVGSPNVCVVSWPLSPCTPPNGPEHPITLSFINGVQALAYGDPALVLLGVVIALGGLGKRGLLAALAEVAARFRFTSPLFALRTIVWPLFLVAGMIGLAESSKDIQAYLHSNRSPSDFVNYAVLAVIWLVVALLAVTLSLGLQFFSVNVTNYALRLLYVVGLVVVLTYWTFSLSLFALNHFLILEGIPARGPFSTLDASTYLSIAVTLGVFIYVLVRPRRKRDRL